MKTYYIKSNHPFAIVGVLSISANEESLAPELKMRLAADSKEVVAYLAAQTEQQQKTQDQAIESEAIDEVVCEQFAKQIAERVAQKKAALEKQRKG